MGCRVRLQSAVRGRTLTPSNRASAQRLIPWLGEADTRGQSAHHGAIGTTLTLNCQKPAIDFSTGRLTGASRPGGDCRNDDQRAVQRCGLTVDRQEGRGLHRRSLGRAEGGEARDDRRRRADGGPAPPPRAPVVESRQPTRPTPATRSGPVGRSLITSSLTFVEFERALLRRPAMTAPVQRASPEGMQPNMVSGQDVELEISNTCTVAAVDVRLRTSSPCTR